MIDGSSCIIVWSDPEQVLDLASTSSIQAHLDEDSEIRRGAACGTAAVKLTNIRVTDRVQRGRESVYVLPPLLT